jgi:hypothetical protein
MSIKEYYESRELDLYVVRRDGKLNRIIDLLKQLFFILIRKKS